MRRPCLQGADGGRRARLVVHRRPGRPHARRDDQEIFSAGFSRDLPRPARLVRAGDDAVDARLQRLTHPQFHQFSRRQAMIIRPQIIVGQAGQDGHAQDLEIRARRPARRRRHHLRSGVDGQQIAARVRQHRRRLLHRRADVVQLPVQKHLGARRLQLARQRHAVRGEQLKPDLVETDRIADPLDQGPRLIGRRHVQGADHARIEGAIGAVCGHFRLSAACRRARMPR